MNKNNCLFQKAKSVLSEVVRNVGRMENAFIISIVRVSYTTMYVYTYSTVLGWVLKGAELHALVFLLRRVNSPMWTKEYYSQNPSNKLYFHTFSF